MFPSADAAGTSSSSGLPSVSSRTEAWIPADLQFTGPVQTTSSLQLGSSHPVCCCTADTRKRLVVHPNSRHRSCIPTATELSGRAQKHSKVTARVTLPRSLKGKQTNRIFGKRRFFSKFLPLQQLRKMHFWKRIPCQKVLKLMYPHGTVRMT